MLTRLEIMDTTLRDGEQMKNVSYSSDEKLALAKILLDEVGVDRIEIASAKVSEGEKEAVRKIVEWANNNEYGEKIEVLGFVDIHESTDWILNLEGKVINILSKGSLKHLTTQLKKTKEQHLKEIKETIIPTLNRYVETMNTLAASTRTTQSNTVDNTQTEAPV